MPLIRCCPCVASAGLALGLVTLAAGCAPARLSLPTGPGEPVANAAPAWREATAACASVTSLTAEIGLSGRAGGRRLRGRLHVGVAGPGRIRLEAVAPFGPPVFILAGSDDDAALLLPRDQRRLDRTPVADIVEALAGIRLTTGDLLGLVLGCPPGDAAAPPTAARGFGGRWIVVERVAGAVYLEQTGGWRVAAGRRPGFSFEFTGRAGGRPTAIRLRTEAAGDRRAADVVLRPGDVETNVPLAEAAFLLSPTPKAAALSLDELRLMLADN